AGNPLYVARGRAPPRAAPRAACRCRPPPTATLEGTLLGTPAYMSPEQAAGERVDQRADLWALGVMLYEMTAGKRPFDGPTPAVLRALLGSAPAPVGELNPDVPVALASIIDRL